jgi:hypothetical protein
MTGNVGEGIPIRQPEPEELDPAILIHPKVLFGLAGDIFSVYAAKEGDFYLTTPFFHLPLPDDEGKRKGLVLGREAASNGIETSLYVVETEFDVLYPYIHFDQDKGVLDVEGNVIEDRDRLLKLRETLLGMKEASYEFVLRPAQTFDRDAFMEEGLSGEIGRLEARLAELRALQAESDEETLHTRIGVHIVSGWEGEEPIDIEYPGGANCSLAEAIMSAATDFKEQNGRTDVQASEVQVTVRRGPVRYDIPGEIWRPYYRTQSTSEHGEEWAINYRQRDIAAEAEKTTPSE